ncbi:CLUMA_CG014806, isoform A [Clunio marinus]|uniref:CLUMA_CG014806, isoform A n=1 Tax=Clunio marinus TaxID=568069 RepID=A0A1J1ILR2_9DIPT|nr:CLUMA_CG014806, isoform A [Clunio marinus]
MQKLLISPNDEVAISVAYLSRHYKPLTSDFCLATNLKYSHSIRDTKLKNRLLKSKQSLSFEIVCLRNGT